MSESILFTNARLFAGVNDEVIDGAAIWIDRLPLSGETK